MIDDARHVRRAWELALRNVEDGGRPFGCVVVDAASGEVLVEAVIQDEHYEDGNDLFRLARFYDEFAKAPADRSLPARQLEPDDPTRPFRAFTERHGDA